VDWSSYETGASQCGPESWNTEADRSKMLEAVNRQQSVKAQETEKAVCAVVIC
jgi:hypothetical protein